MAHRWVVSLSRMLAGSDPWEDTVVSWQQQIDAAFGRASRSRLPSAGPAILSQPSPDAARRQSSRPARRRA